VNKGLDEVPKSEALDEKHGDSDEAPRDSEHADEDNEEDAEETAAFEEVKLWYDMIKSGLVSFVENRLF